MKYLAVPVVFALIGMFALPWLMLSRIESTPSVGPNGETLVACGMPVLGALFSAPIGAVGGAFVGLLAACFLPSWEE